MSGRLCQGPELTRGPGPRARSTGVEAVHRSSLLAGGGWRARLLVAVAVLAGAGMIGAIGAASSTLASLSVQKTADVAGFAAPDEAITYTYTVTNTGGVDLYGITVTDSRLGAVSGCAAALAPGQATTCTAAYDTTAADVSAGDIVNSVTVSGSGPAGQPAQASAWLSIPAVHHAAIVIAKTASAGSFTRAGVRIIFTYTVANTGNVAMHDVRVTDPRVPYLMCRRSLLVPGGVMVCRMPYTTTAADVVAGRVVNTGTATGLSPARLRASASAAVIIPLQERAAIAIAKSASPSAFSAAGTVITYTYRVGNTGNVALHDVTVSDSRLGWVPCPARSLAVGASMTCTARHTTTAANVTARSITNTGSVAGLTAGGTRVRAQSTVTLPLTAVRPVRVTG